MSSKILLGQLDQVGIVSTSSVHNQLDPVFNGKILSLAHPPDVASLNCMGEDGIASVIGNNNGALSGDLESLVVAAVFFSLLCHQTNIGDMSSGSPVKLTIGLTIPH